MERHYLEKLFLKIYIYIAHFVLEHSQGALYNTNNNI